jgi:hypothetical protein
MSETPDTDALAELLAAKCSHSDTSYFEMRMLSRKIERQRDDAIKKLEIERFIANSLAEVLKRYYDDDTIPHKAGVSDAIAIWKGARGE